MFYLFYLFQSFYAVYGLAFFVARAYDLEAPAIHLEEAALEVVHLNLALAVIYVCGSQNGNLSSSSCSSVVV